MFVIISRIILVGSANCISFHRTTKQEVGKPVAKQRQDRNTPSAGHHSNNGLRAEDSPQRNSVRPSKFFAYYSHVLYTELFSKAPVLLMHAYQQANKITGASSKNDQLLRKFCNVGHGYCSYTV